MEQKPPLRPVHQVSGLEDGKMSGEITMYGHRACPAVGPIKGLLKQSNVEFEYIDIHKDGAAAAHVALSITVMRVYPHLSFLTIAR